MTKEKMTTREVVEFMEMRNALLDCPLSLWKALNSSIEMLKAVKADRSDREELEKIRDNVVALVEQYNATRELVTERYLSYNSEYHGL